MINDQVKVGKSDDKFHVMLKATPNLRKAMSKDGTLQTCLLCTNITELLTQGCIKRYQTVKGLCKVSATKYLVSFFHKLQKESETEPYNYKTPTVVRNYRHLNNN